MLSGHVFEYVSGNALSALQAVRIIGGGAISLLFKKKNELFALNYQKEGDTSMTIRYKKTAEELLVENILQTNDHCPGQPFRVVRPEDPEFTVLDFNNTQIKHASRVDLMPCAALTTRDLAALIRGLAGHESRFSAIAYATAMRLLNTGPQEGKVEVVLPSAEQYLTQDDASALFISLSTWNIENEKRMAEEYEILTQKIREYVATLQLNKEAAELRTSADLYHAAVHGAAFSSALTAVREVAVLSGARQAQADNLVDMIALGYFAVSAGIMPTLTIYILNHITSKLSSRWIENTNLRFMCKLVTMLTFENLFAEVPDFQHLAYRTLIRNLATISASVGTKGLIRSAYQYFFGDHTIVTLGEKKNDVQLVDSEEHLLAAEVAREFTVTEIAEKLLQYLEANNVTAATHLLEELGRASQDMQSVVVNHAYYDLPHMPTALTLMCKQGNLKMAKLLITYHANINYEHDEGSPLLIAVKLGYLEMVKMLLAKGATTSCFDPDTNGSLLHVAAEHNQIAVLKYFRQHFKQLPFDLNFVSSQLQTPVEVAIAKGHDEAAEVLDAMANDIIVQAKQAKHKEMAELVQAAQFSEQGVCHWIENEGEFSLMIPCRDSKPLSAFFHYLDLPEHQTDGNVISMTESCVQRLIAELANDAVFWRDYNGLMVGFTNLLTVAGFHFDVIYGDKGTSFVFDDAQALALLGSLKLKNIIKTKEQSCFVEFNLLEIASAAQRAYMIECLRSKEENLVNIRNQFLACWHGVTQREAKILNGHLVLALSFKKYALLSPLLGYFKFKKAEANQYSVSCDVLQAKITKPLPDGLIQHLRARELAFKIFIREAKNVGECNDKYEEHSLTLTFVSPQAQKLFNSACVAGRVNVTALSGTTLQCSYQSVFLCHEKTFQVAPVCAVASISLFKSSGSASACDSVPAPVLAAGSVMDNNSPPSSASNHRVMLVKRLDKKGGKASAHRPAVVAVAPRKRSEKAPRKSSVPEQVVEGHDLLLSRKDTAPYVYVPYSEEHSHHVYTLAKMQADDNSQKHRAVRVLDIFEGALRYELSYLIGLQLWFDDLSRESKSDPICVFIKLDGIRISVSHFLLALHLRINSIKNCEHITENDKEAWPYRNDVEHHFVIPENLEKFVYYLLNDHIQHALDSVIHHEPKKHHISLQKYAGLFKMTQQVDKAELAVTLMERLYKYIHHYDDKICAHNESDIANAMLTARIPDKIGVAFLVHEVRAMYSCMIQLVDLIVHHKEKLKDIQKNIRHFMSSCATLRNLSQHHLVYDETTGFDPVPLYVVLAKAREGASIWVKEKSADRVMRLK